MTLRTPQFLVLVLVLLAAGVLIGWWLAPAHGPGTAHGPVAAAPAAGEREILYWVAPMDANFRRDGPGKSPMGMDLVPVYADSVDADPAVVRVDAAVQANFGVRSAVVERNSLARTVVATGRVAWDGARLRRVTTRAAGWVERLGVAAVGDRVQAGQVLFHLFAPELVNAQEEFLAALKGDHAGLRAAARERLLALGLTADDVARLERERRVQRTLPVLAPGAAVVAELPVREGEYVMPSRPLMTLADPAQVWVLADVVERQAHRIRVGQAARVVFSIAPLPPRDAVVELVQPELDPRTRTVPVRLRLDNQDGALLPNMLTEVTVLVPPSMPLVHVPREAVIHGARGARVVVDLGAGRFRVQPVEIGYEANGRIVVRDGLRAGDRVVVSGQFLVDSEADVDSALQRLDSGGRS